MSETRVLTAVDLVGIQRFIFSSNRLKDVTGASYLVNRALAANGAIRACGGEPAVIVAGGGNAVLEFHGSDALRQARIFAGRYSRWLIDHAPGLDAVLAHQEYTDGFAGALDALLAKVARAKFERVPSVPLLGLGVTAACRETGLPASEVSHDGQPLAASVRSIRDASDDAKEYWNDLLLSGRRIGDEHLLAFPMELDDMGRTESQTSLIAVVHIDGNGVGSKIIQWLKQAASDERDDDETKAQYQAWSQSIDALGQKMMTSIVNRVEKALCRLRSQTQWKLQGRPAPLAFNLKSASGEVFLPLRPVILGGDDLTFLCDGRIALDLAAAALEIFRQEKIIEHLAPEGLGACAGVAIVHAHAPILRAWALAEELCRSAKREVKKCPGPEFALDWHLGLPAPGQSVENLREKQYATRSSPRLTCRPLMLGQRLLSKVESWNWLESSLLDDHDSKKRSLRGPVWAERRNKVKQLAPLVRAGSDEVKNALQAWRVVDKELKLPDEVEHGFFGNARTPLLDASELLDVHLSLEQEAG